MADFDKARFNELYEKNQRRQHLDSILKELREKIKELEPKVRRLATEKALEQEDVDKLEGVSIKSFFYSLTGRKHDIIDKERQEAYEAKKRYDAASFELETLKNDLEKYIGEMADVKYIEREYEKMAAEKAELIMQKGGQAAVMLTGLNEKLNYLMEKNNELRQVRTLANRAMGTAEHMKAVLSKADKVNKMDMFGANASGGKNIAQVKHDLMVEAESLSNDLFAQIHDLEKEARGTSFENKASISTNKTEYYMDFHMDFFGQDLRIMSKIKETMASLETVIQGIKEFIEPLNVQIEQNEDNRVKALKERDDLIKNTEV